MVGSNPWKSFIRLISFEGIFQSPQPKSKFQTQEMRKVSLPQGEIVEISGEYEQRQTLIEAERINQ